LSEPDRPLLLVPLSDHRDHRLSSLSAHAADRCCAAGRGHNATSVPIARPRTGTASACRCERGIRAARHSRASPLHRSSSTPPPHPRPATRPTSWCHWAAAGTGTFLLLFSASFTGGEPSARGSSTARCRPSSEIHRREPLLRSSSERPSPCGDHRTHHPTSLPWGCSRQHPRSPAIPSRGRLDVYAGEAAIAHLMSRPRDRSVDARASNSSLGPRLPLGLDLLHLGQRLADSLLAVLGRPPSRLAAAAGFERPRARLESFTQPIRALGSPGFFLHVRWRRNELLPALARTRHPRPERPLA